MSDPLSSAVFTFPGTQQAMIAEDILRETGASLEVVPPPQELRAGCGLALRVTLKNVPAALMVLRAGGTTYSGLHRLGPDQQVVEELG